MGSAQDMSARDAATALLADLPAFDDDDVGSLRTEDLVKQIAAAFESYARAQMADVYAIRCKRCDAFAAGIFWMPEGCVCSPDRLQALCLQHASKTRDTSIAGISEVTTEWLAALTEARSRLLAVNLDRLPHVNHARTRDEHPCRIFDPAVRVCDCGLDALRASLVYYE